MSRVDEAYQAIRAHLHERPYADDPAQIYTDLGALSQLLNALSEVTRGVADAAKRATGSDDGWPDDHVADVDMFLFQARGRLGSSRSSVDAAHIHVGHLIFGDPSGMVVDGYEVDSADLAEPVAAKRGDA